MRQRLPTEYFLRIYATFLRKHPGFERKVENIIDRLARNDQTLRVHTLHGPLHGYYAVRITQSYRIVFALEADAIIFIDIGSHDDVY